MNLNYVIIILGLILAIIYFTKDKYLEGKIPDWLFLVVIIILLATAVTNVYITQQEEEKEKYSEYSGVISGELKNKSIAYPSIKLGTAKLVWQGPEGEPIFLIGNDPIRVWIEEGELKISTVIRNEDGKIIARLEANEWQVNPNLIFDRNFDKEAVEVINEKGEVILQAEFDGESVQFAGIFYREDGWRIALGYNIIESRPPSERIQASFEPIFKYPSKNHPGERR